MAVLLDQTISGSGVTTFANSTILSIAINVTALGNLINIIDPSTNRRIARCGWICLEDGGTIGTIGPTVFAGWHAWIDFETQYFAIPTFGPQFADRVRWSLYPNASARIVVST